MPTTVYRDKIKSFSGSWSSGLATLSFQSGRSIPADSGPLGRALGGMFDAIGSGHTINNGSIRGQDIIYAIEPWGTLAGINTYEN